MKPILWLYLFIMFFFMIFLYSLLNYYVIIFNKKNKIDNLKFNCLSWKW